MATSNVSDDEDEALTLVWRRAPESVKTKVMSMPPVMSVPRRAPTAKSRLVPPVAAVRSLPVMRSLPEAPAARPAPATRPVPSAPASTRAVGASLHVIRPPGMSHASITGMHTSLLRLSPALLSALAVVAPKKRRSLIRYAIGVAIVAIVAVLAADASTREFVLTMGHHLVGR